MTSEEFLTLTAPAEVTELGKPEHVFVKGEGLLTDKQVWAILAMGIGLCALGGVVAFVARLESPEALIMPGIGIVVCLFAVFLLAMGGAQRADVGIAVCPDGLAFLDAGHWTAVRWDDVVEHRGHSLGWGEVKLKLQDGNELKLRRFVGDADRMFHEIERRVYPGLMGKAAAVLEAGGTVMFDKLGVSRAGLTYKNREFAWHAVPKLAIGQPVEGGEALVDIAHPMRLKLLVAHPPHQRTLMWGDLGKPLSDWWFSGDFLSLPNRTVLLTLLSAGKPPHLEFPIAPAVWHYLPPATEPKPPSPATVAPAMEGHLDGTA